MMNICYHLGFMRKAGLSSTIYVLFDLFIWVYIRGICNENWIVTGRCILEAFSWKCFGYGWKE